MPYYVVHSSPLLHPTGWAITYQIRLLYYHLGLVLQDCSKVGLTSAIVLPRKQTNVLEMQTLLKDCCLSTVLKSYKTSLRGILDLLQTLVVLLANQSATICYNDVYSAPRPALTATVCRGQSLSFIAPIRTQIRISVTRVNSTSSYLPYLRRSLTGFSTPCITHIQSRGIYTRWRLLVRSYILIPQMFRPTIPRSHQCVGLALGKECFAQY